MRSSYYIFCFLILVFTNILNAESSSPDEVSVNIFIIDIKSIDDVNQLVSIDFAIIMRWKDVSFADDNHKASKIDISNYSKLDIQIANDFNLQTKNPEYIITDAKGNAVYQQRFYGQITASHNFSEYPFDDYEIKIDFINFGNEHINFSKGNEDFQKDPSKYSITDWKVNKGNLTFVEKDSYKGILKGFTYSLNAVRYQSYFVWKVIVPLMLVVFMSWTVFWIDPNMPAQLTVAATAMLTIIAYQFTLSGLLPKISYSTRLDVFIVGSIIIIFLALVESIFTSNLVTRNLIEKARKVDLISRFIFPILYLIILMIAFVF